MLETLLVGQTWSFMLVFARVGSAAMILPGIGDAYVSPQIRLLFALAFALVLTPVIAPVLPALPDHAIGLVALVFGEIAIGLFIATLARLMVAALETAGMIISNQIGLAAAQVFNPALSTQGSVVGGFLSALGVVALFVTDMHHLLLLAIAESYSVFPAGMLPGAGDTAATVVEIVGRTFRVGLDIAMPFIVLGLLFNLGLGLVARLQPQIQVFFVAQPIQIAAGLLMLAVGLTAGMTLWMQHIQDLFAGFLPSR